MKHYTSGKSHKANPLAKFKKRATYFLMALVLLATGYLAFTVLSDPFPSTAAVFNTDVIPEFYVSADLDVPINGVQVKNAVLKVSLGDSVATFSGGKLSIDGLIFESFSGKDIIISGYTGLVNSDNGVAVLSGKAKSAILDDVVINKNNAWIEIETDNLEFETLQISDLTTKSLSITSTGLIDVAGKGTFDLHEEKLDMRSFAGFIDIDEQKLRLNGRVKSLVIYSVPKITIE